MALHLQGWSTKYAVRNLLLPAGVRTALYADSACAAAGCRVGYPHAESAGPLAHQHQMVETTPCGLLKDPAHAQPLTPPAKPVQSCMRAHPQSATGGAGSIPASAARRALRQWRAAAACHHGQGVCCALGPPRRPRCATVGSAVSQHPQSIGCCCSDEIQPGSSTCGSWQFGTSSHQSAFISAEPWGTERPLGV